MRFKKLLISYGLLFSICVSLGRAQQPVKDKALPQHRTGGQGSPAPQTVTIASPQAAQPSSPAHEAGFMDPAQVKDLVHKIRLTEYRINDLLTDVHPDKWKTSSVTRDSFTQTLETLRQVMAGLEEWRAQFERRPDSIYFGFQTYTAIDAALPRLDGVARAVSQFQNASFGAQYSQAGNQLFDLQQALQPYVAYLLRGPDQAMDVAQTNLAACQNQLGQAMRGQTEPATPLKNTFVELHTRRNRKGRADSVEKRDARQGEEKKATTEKKPETKPK